MNSCDILHELNVATMLALTEEKFEPGTSAIHLSDFPLSSKPIGIAG
jgi:hypothetical protein